MGELDATFYKKLSRLREAGSPPAAYAAQIRRVRDLSCRDLSEFLQIVQRSPSRSLEEYLEEGGDLPVRVNCITYPFEGAAHCVAVSLAREEAAARARWTQLKAAWVAAVLRARRPARGGPPQ